MDTGATRLFFNQEIYKNQKLKLVNVKKISVLPRLYFNHFFSLFDLSFLTWLDWDAYSRKPCNILHDAFSRFPPVLTYVFQLLTRVVRCLVGLPFGCIPSKSCLYRWCSQNCIQIDVQHVYVEQLSYLFIYHILKFIFRCLIFLHFRPFSF